MPDFKTNSESERLREAREAGVPWRLWGPYLSERQWGTVREDYSTDGNAWGYFTHDQARSRAYHWGEDGIAGISDDQQRLCFSLALWNGRDPILKERMFGLTNSEGNHGEDVKEYYFYLDSTPTHSYMKFLYKYPHAAYPYNDLVSTNARRSRCEFEYELIDTGIFRENRYFDITVEYAKAGPEDILIRVMASNRGSDTAELHLLPTLWFRNIWSWWPMPSKPLLRAVALAGRPKVVRAAHPEMSDFWLYTESSIPLLFTENETNNARLFRGVNPTPFVKDGINDYVVDGRQSAVNPANEGTRAAAHYKLLVNGGGSVTVRLRLTDVRPEKLVSPFDGFEGIVKDRLDEADSFYRGIGPHRLDSDSAAVMRQAFAGMLWSKQFYLLEGDRWLNEHGVEAYSDKPTTIRNHEWAHVINRNVISMPDKWEYPWYAAWDLAFHSVVLAMVDVDFAKSQLEMLMKEIYMHPSGQIPAYEWNFGDVNPPVHAWASLFVYRIEQAFRGEGDISFMKRIFGHLMYNFAWWVNRKDRFGKNVFEGGFLGLDNIGVFDRSAPLPTGGYLEQADGTAWMAMFCQNMLEIAVEIAAKDNTYEDLAAKFADQFLLIAHGINRVGDEGMWDEADGFYYDVLRTPSGDATRLKVRSLVGLLPLCATAVVEPRQRERIPRLMAYWRERIRQMPGLLTSIHPTGPGHLGYADRGILALVHPDRLRRILSRMLDEEEFLSPYGLRSISRYHLDHPYIFNANGQEYRVDYLPAESNTGMFGGNSNWRGPIWMPLNVLLIRALMSFYLYYGESFKVECPTHSGTWMNLFEVARDIAMRLTRIFVRGHDEKRPVFGGNETFQNDPYWRDNLLFYEYFHGDNGAGLGASHQTGWTGLVAALIRLFGHLDASDFLEQGRQAAFQSEDAKTNVLANV